MLAAAQSVAVAGGLHMLGAGVLAGLIWSWLVRRRLTQDLKSLSPMTWRGLGTLLFIIVAAEVWRLGETAAERASLWALYLAAVAALQIAVLGYLAGRGLPRRWSAGLWALLGVLLLGGVLLPAAGLGNSVLGDEANARLMARLDFLALAVMAIIIACGVAFLIRRDDLMGRLQWAMVLAILGVQVAEQLFCQLLADPYRAFGAASSCSEVFTTPYLSYYATAIVLLATATIYWRQSGRS